MRPGRRARRATRPRLFLWSVSHCPGETVRNFGHFGQSGTIDVRMSRISGAVTWGIRWETVEPDSGTAIVAGVLADTYDNRRHACRAQRRLGQKYPVMANPLWRNETKRVRYFVFARGPDDSSARYRHRHGVADSRGGVLGSYWIVASSSWQPAISYQPSAVLAGRTRSRGEPGLPVRGRPSPRR